MRACSLSRVWLCDSMDCSPPGSSVHGILQARVLEWVAISSSTGSSWPKDRTFVSWGSCIGKQILYNWAPGSPVAVIEVIKRKREGEKEEHRAEWCFIGKMSLELVTGKQDLAEEKHVRDTLDLANAAKAEVQRGMNRPAWEREAGTQARISRVAQEFYGEAVMLNVKSGIDTRVHSDINKWWNKWINAEKTNLPKRSSNKIG